MELFDYIDCMFSKEKYKDVKPNVKKKFSFQLLRYVSIAFPMEANAFNQLGVNEIAISDYWNWYFTLKFKRPPQWLYTKTKKAEEKDHKIDKKLLLQYCKEFNIDSSELKLLNTMFIEELKESLKEYKKLISDTDI